MHAEYPKMIYKGGVIGDDFKIVNNEAEEEDAEGYAAHGAEKEDADTPAVRRGRPPKA